MAKIIPVCRLLVAGPPEWHNYKAVKEQLAKIFERVGDLKLLLTSNCESKDKNFTEVNAAWWAEKEMVSYKIFYTVDLPAKAKPEDLLKRDKEMVAEATHVLLFDNGDDDRVDWLTTHHNKVKVIPI